mmetsp:Transcript_26890/g.64535  ORF Transcript_26890/g.64535 Transcript_26890/m.64535 type:complete len:846 (+) Transcript_26890:343-2880(+)
MMPHLPKKLLLVALLPTAQAGKSSSVTKTFKFKDDFYLKFDPLSTAIGPDNVGALMSALKGFAPHFKDVWTKEIESSLQGGNGNCVVDNMELPKFSMCDWKYPDLYDIDELPTPGQCYEHENGFIQRIYYKIKKLKITCPVDFDYDDLKRDVYTDAAFSDNFLLEYINPPNDGCDGDDSTCVFATAETVETSSFDVCNAELFINRFVDIPVYLKCLDYIDGYGPKTANKLIKSLDKFFELKVSPVIQERILDQAPTGFVYNIVSPYASDRKYCGHGRYYSGGSLVDQVVADDEILITKFTYGFDVIWYKPKDFDSDDLLEDEDISVVINSVFEEEDFLSFLRQEYPDYDFIQDVELCDVIDPGGEGVTFPPTEEPTSSPTGTPSASPNILITITSDPTMSPSTDSPTISPTLRPVTLSPTISNPPSKMIEPSASPSHSSIPSSEPTLIPTPIPSTLTPTSSPTGGVTDTENTDKTISPTPTTPAVTTPSPTCPNCIIHPGDLVEDECPIATTGTCSDGKRGDGSCPFAGFCCSKWGYCGTTAEYCEDDSIAPTPSIVPGVPAAPTYSVDAGQCANGNEGDGFCPEKSLCCSDWGYCGSGEQYCFSTRINSELSESGDGTDDGTCGGGGAGDGNCRDDLCCSKFGFCGEGELFCTGINELQESDESAGAAEQVIKNSPLPENLIPEFGFRCGVTEVDARSNCKSECTHLVQCAVGEECWGVQLNYCNTFEEGEHPICTNLKKADNDSRCGYDEASARGYCGLKCVDDGDCGDREYCLPTLLNLCECHEETCPEESSIAFAKAKALVSSYFVEEDPNNSMEGKPRNSSYNLDASMFASLLVIFMSLM